MLNILFLTRKFAPQNYIGAVRPTKIAKYLTRYYDCSVNVVCMQDKSNVIDPIGKKDIVEINNIKTVDPCKWTDIIRSKYDEKATRIKTQKILSSNKVSKNQSSKNFRNRAFEFMHRIGRAALYIVSICDSYFYGKSVLKRLKHENKSYEAYFSTTTIIESYVVGKWLKKHNDGLRWIYDLRDPLRISSYPGISRKIMQYVLKKTIPLVDEVTGVSQACIQEFIDAGHTNTHVILNGFDTEDISELKDTPTVIADDSIFKIVYTGSLYDGKRDVTPLLLLLLSLNEENVIDLNKIEVHYAGKDFHVLQNAVKKTGVNIKIINHGFIPRDESIRLQLSADALLLLSWNNTGDTGVVTGKFYEYLMMNRPIICIVKGDLPNSVLRRMIEESGVGTCYEEAAEETQNKSRIYISNIFKNKFDRGKIFRRDANVEEYNYKNIAGKIFQLCIKD